MAKSRGGCSLYYYENVINKNNLRKLTFSLSGVYVCVVVCVCARVRMYVRTRACTRMIDYTANIFPITCQDCAENKHYVVVTKTPIERCIPIS